MNAEIIGVGTELLMGQIANTNAQFISGKLQELGINVFYHTVVGDNPDRLKDTLRHSIERSDLVITTGGLGPTQDDLTKETIASFFNIKLIKHERSINKIEAFFKKLGRDMTDNNYKQAQMPEGCEVIPNNYGTAPGCIIDKNNKMVILLPGPPAENIPMMNDTVIPYLRERTDSKLISRYIKVFGIGESTVEERIKDIISLQTDPTIAPYAKAGELTLRVTTKVKKEKDADKKLLPFIDRIKERLGDAIYSIEDETLCEVAAKLLLEQKTTISVAESCTGGLVCKMLTDIPGISKVFSKGVVAYSNSAKIDELGVNTDTLIKHGAVSRETAIEMAKGILRRTGTDIGVSVTGIAGPSGGSDEKPVGLVYIAIADKNGFDVTKKMILGNRDRVRYVTALNVFNILRKKLKERQ